jgi:hypothetical protein
MRLPHLGKSLFGKAALATAALSGLFLFTSVPRAQAADRDDGQRRSAVSEHRFSDGDRGYYADRGYDTRQTDNWREERREAFERNYRDYRNDWRRDRDDYRYHRDRDRDRD